MKIRKGIEIYDIIFDYNVQDSDSLTKKERDKMKNLEREKWVSVKSMLEELYKIRDENILVGSKILNLIMELENKEAQEITTPDVLQG